MVDHCGVHGPRTRPACRSRLGRQPRGPGRHRYPAHLRRVVTDDDRGLRIDGKQGEVAGKCGTRTGLRGSSALSPARDAAGIPHHRACLCAGDKHSVCGIAQEEPFAGQIDESGTGQCDAFAAARNRQVLLTGSIWCFIGMVGITRNCRYAGERGGKPVSPPTPMSRPWSTILRGLFRIAPSRRF